MNVVPDTSVIVDGRVLERVESDDLEGASIIVPEVVVNELESQANRSEETGWDGLTELEQLASYEDDDRIELKYVDHPPARSDRRGVYRGANDAIIREIAYDYEAVLFTSDRVQSKVARRKGIEVEYIRPVRRELDQLPIEPFFDDETLSLHLKAGTEPMAKRGHVGEMHYQSIRDEIATEDELKEYAYTILDTARRSNEAFIELDEDGMQIVQFGPFRIAIARPPFSDAWEITAVRALVKTSLEDYVFADELKNRLLERQRGILIAGAPGAGKSTFAQAVAEFLSGHDFAVKTMEKPRDLQVSPGITQYTALGGRMKKTADSLLMVRPDYTIYDEVRKTSDFEVFADMRLAGVGMVGVVHATRAIDALQRLVGRVEFGMIPQIVDTVVYIEDGQIAQVYDIAIEVKLPEGMVEEDLARPVVTVRDFETGTPEYELYLYARQVITVPIETSGERETGVEQLAKEEIEREIRSVARGRVDVELRGGNRAIVYVDEDDISYVIGKEGGQIAKIEQRLGIDIDVRTHKERPATNTGREAGGERVIEITPEFTEQHIILPVATQPGQAVEVWANDEYLFTATVGRGGEIQVSRGTAIADELKRCIDVGQRITAVLPTQ